MNGKEIVVFGRVQGVGFRRFVHQQAKICNIKGYVQNRPDGSVYVIAYSEAKNLQLFLSLISKGNSFSRVERIQESDLNSSNSYDRFSIR